MGDGLILVALAVGLVAMDVHRALLERRLSVRRSDRRMTERAQRAVMYAMGIEVGFVAYAVHEGKPWMAIDVLRASAPNIERIGRDHGYVVTTLPASDATRTVVRLVKRRDTACDA